MSVYYRNRISIPLLEYSNETETRKASTRRAARDREGKKPFPIALTIFKSQTLGERREGEANPSARGVNRDKRRIVLRIQSVTIQAAYGVWGGGRDMT